LSSTLQPRELSLYESFYGLAQTPFALAPDPRFLYLSESHHAAIKRILQSLRRREPFIVLSGDIGTGKTTLCRALLEQLDKTAFSSLVLNPFLSIEELLRQVLVDYGVVSREGLLSERFANATKHELITTLSEFLITLAPLRGSAVVIIDEAQHLKPDVLEELRVVAGMHSDARLLQIVLVGQPGLLDVLGAADLRQLDQRISLKAMLQPLDREDVEHYISHRLTVAGESVSVVFEKGAIKRLHALSGGVPRVINLLCDRALMAGADRGVHEITPAMIDQAHDALSFRRPATEDDRPGGLRRSTPKWALALAVVVALLLPLPLIPWHRLVETTAPALPAAPPQIEAPEFAPLPIPPDYEELTDGNMFPRPAAPAPRSPAVSAAVEP
jgi:general secretion pathway protein A